MSSYLLDTCIVIDFLRGQEAAKAFLQKLPSRPHVSVVTLTKIFAGLRSRKEETAVRAFFADCRIWNLTPDISENAGYMLRHYRPSLGIDVPDALIAATAEHHRLELATLNVKHFPMFKRLKPAY